MSLVLFADITKVYLNGRFMAPREATISPFDRGFIFGDGIYEVIPAYGGRPFRWPQHLDRLNGNLAEVGIREPMSAEEWASVMQELLAGSDDKDQYIYLQVTRGVAPRDHAFPADVPPTVFAYCQLLHPVPEQVLREGVTAITLPDMRWQRCDVKTTSLLANVWLRQQAIASGASEAILVRHGEVTEGAATNVFAVIDNTIYTPPHSTKLLPGVTRDLIVELLQTKQLNHKENVVTAEQLHAAREIWLTSSTKEMVPVVELDRTPVSDGKPGPLFHQVYTLFQEYKAECRSGKIV